MGKLFVQMSVSVDGFIEDPAGGMDWFAGDARFDELLTSTLRGIDGIIFGRRAHELGAAYWPTAGETAETAEVADQIALMNSLPFRRRAGGGSWHSTAARSTSCGSSNTRWCSPAAPRYSPPTAGAAR
jgi:hypothetical protein